MSIFGGDGVIEASDIPQYARPEYSFGDQPDIYPRNPSVDHRAGGNWGATPGSYGVPADEIDGYIYFTARYAKPEDGGALIESTGPTEVSREVAVLEGTYPSDAGDTLFQVGVIAFKDTPAGRRYSNDGDPRWSDTEEIIVIHNTLDPQVGTPKPSLSYADTNVGTTVTINPGTWINADGIAIKVVMRRDGVDVPAANGFTYTLVTADLDHTLSWWVYPDGFYSLGYLAGSLTVTTTAITWPANLARSQVSFEEIAPADASPTGTVGQRIGKYGTNAGGAALSPPSGFTYRVWSSGVKGGSDAISNSIDSSGAVPTSNLDVWVGSGSQNFATAYPAGTVRYFGVIAWHTATGTWQHVMDQTDLWASGPAVGLPYGTVVIQGDEVVTPPPTLTPIDAMGKPVNPTAFYDAAIEAQHTRASGPGTMADVYSVVSKHGLGIGVINGHAGSIARAKAQTDYILDTGAPSLHPHFTGSYYSNCDNPLAAMWVCMKYSPSWTNGDLTTSQKNRITAAMKVAAFSAAYVTSDNNPDYISNNNPKTIRGYNANNPKDTAFNQSGQGHCLLMNAMAFFGGPANLKNLLTNTTPTQVDSELSGVGFPSSSNLRKTIDWLHANYSGGSVLGTANSSEAPTETQIINAVKGNWKWWGVDLENYHRILAMITFLAPNGQEKRTNTPWIGNGVFGSGKYSMNSNPPGKAITINRGWGSGFGLGNDPDGDGDQQANPVTTKAAAVNGCLDSDVPDPRYMGRTGAVSELFCWRDESPRSEVHYAVEGYRTLMSAWLSMTVSGLLNPKNADIVSVLPVLHRGVYIMEYCHSQGFQSYAHDKPSAHYPNSQNHLLGTVLYEIWNEVIGVAYGCGPQLVRNSNFSSSAYWEGFGSGGRSISGSKASFSGVAAGVANGINIPVSMVPGKYVQVEYTVSSRGSGDVVAALTDGTARVGTPRSANGTYKERLLVNTGNARLALYSTTGGATYMLDDVRVSGPFETATVDTGD